MLKALRYSGYLSSSHKYFVNNAMVTKKTSQHAFNLQLVRSAFFFWKTLMYLEFALEDQL